MTGVYVGGSPREYAWRAAADVSSIEWRSAMSPPTDPSNSARLLVIPLTVATALIRRSVAAAYGASPPPPPMPMAPIRPALTSGRLASLLAALRPDEPTHDRQSLMR